MDEAKEQTAVTVGEAYVSGALTALDDAPRTKVFYELLAEIAEAANLRAYLPHRVTDPIAQAHLDPRAVYEIDRAHITGASVLIAYAGIPSFGVGIEVELARERGVPVVVVAERDRPISRLLLGNPAVVADDVVVQRFIASLGHARELSGAEVAALLRIADLDGEAAAALKDAVASGRLFGAGLRDLVGRYALRGPDLGAFILRDVLERPLAETARALGIDARTAKRHLGTARARVGLPEDAETSAVAQWLVTELIAPPTRALQLHLFTGGRA